MMFRVRNMVFSLLAVLMLACTSRKPEAKFDKLDSQYAGKKISNYQMLLGMGELFLSNPDNAYIRDGYFNRMIISGYSSWVLHYYLSETERIKSETEQKLILYALAQGRQYQLAGEFTGLFDEVHREKLNNMIALGDSLTFHNDQVQFGNNASALTARAYFFGAIGAKEMAGIDLNMTLKIDQCQQDALFQNIMMLFGQESTREIIRILDRCKKASGDDSPEWNAVFYKLAADIEKVNNSTVPENEKLFQMANLYVNSGFPEIAVKKSAVLVNKQNDNPDYLALHAFVNYRLGDKQTALKFLNQAEAITGRTSRLRSMVESME